MALEGLILIEYSLTGLHVEIQHTNKKILPYKGGMVKRGI